MRDLADASREVETAVGSLGYHRRIGVSAYRRIGVSVHRREAARFARIRDALFNQWRASLLA
ncbi:hypothetical protein BN2475_220024 [Paraburkholderia ribeironis]|uniref:Uncharacterized protein n=1 Tax=Paraburkholderia ribeironis TaxID=1247936 RepID=A0A1N7RX48_9BURK|nr:hypothetical protein BN2475_220024 [Paraburkholderia ribeironis]